MGSGGVNTREERKVKGRGWGGLQEGENRKMCRWLGNWFIALGCVLYASMCVAGAVSLAGAQNNLWAVEGGNKMVCSGLLKMANANLLQAQVNSISPVPSGTPPCCLLNKIRICVLENSHCL